MNDVLPVAAEVQAFCEAQRWSYCIIGGVAALHWGEPRVTRDVDFTLLTGFGNEEQFIGKMLSMFDGRIPDAAAFALQHRVLLLTAKNGVGIDIALGALPFEEAAVRRAIIAEVSPGIRLKICTAEDLIVFKVFASRPIDWRDVEAVIARQKNKSLDWTYITTQLKPLLVAKEQPELMNQLKALRIAAGNG